jgi:predicted ATPase
VGKTRLAIQAAQASLAAGLFPDGVAFVALAPLGNAALVLSTIGQALNVREAENLSSYEALSAYLREKRLLLVLDNFEHVLEAAPEVATLIESCPNLTVLATSRAPLRVRGEQEYPVPPLDVPDPARAPDPQDVVGAPAVELFVQRARAVSPAFEFAGHNAWAVVEICWRLEGLPLALELAAARVKFLGPTALLSRLDRALEAGGARDLPERQRTMRATLDWSYELLHGPEKELFGGLSVFAGGFGLEAAEAVGAAGNVDAEDVLVLLGNLVEQSLVVAESAAGGCGVRYRMLEPVRQYARGLLEESGQYAATRERHAEYFVALAEAARPELMGAEHEGWLQLLEREHDNLREALRWARETGDVERGLRLSAALCWFWWMHGYLGEGRRWVEGFLAEDSEGTNRPAGVVLARAKALYGAGELAFGQGDLLRAAQLFEESLLLYRELGDEEGVAVVSVELGQVARARGEHERAAALSEEGLDLSRKVGERRATAIALNTLGHVERWRGDIEGAIARYEQSLALFRELGHEWGGAYALANLGVVALEGGDFERAQALSEESLSLYEKRGDKGGVALALINLGDVARKRSDEERAAALYNDALALHRELGNQRGVARALERLSLSAQR